MPENSEDPIQIDLIFTEASWDRNRCVKIEASRFTLHNKSITAQFCWAGGAITPEKHHLRDKTQGRV